MQTRDQSIKSYINLANRESTDLLLEGTGPRVTMALPYLSSLDIEELAKFKEIHAFSGGVYAYLVCVAEKTGFLLKPIEDYFKTLDPIVRAAHNKQNLQFLRILKRAIFKQPLYSDTHYMDVARATFKPEFLEAKLSDLSDNFSPYVGVIGSKKPVPIASVDGQSKESITVGNVITYAMRIPFLFGKPSLKAPFYDANYAPAFIEVRRELINSDRNMLALSMWNKASRGTTQFVNLVSADEKAKKVFRRDISSVVFNRANPMFEQDLRRAYADATIPERRG